MFETLKSYSTNSFYYAPSNERRYISNNHRKKQNFKYRIHKMCYFASLSLDEELLLVGFMISDIWFCFQLWVSLKQHLNRLPLWVSWEPGAQEWIMWSSIGLLVHMHAAHVHVFYPPDFLKGRICFWLVIIILNAQPSAWYIEWTPLMLLLVTMNWFGIMLERDVTCSDSALSNDYLIEGSQQSHEAGVSPSSYRHWRIENLKFREVSNLSKMTQARQSPVYIL